jgi:hypothetical protein
MRNYTKIAASALALIGALALPVRAPAATSSATSEPARFAMQTSYYDTRTPGAFLGRMTLNVYPSGIVNGYYFPDGGLVRNVTGGLDGDKIWLNIGGVDSLRLNGTLKDGVLKTTAFIPGPDTWLFESSNTTRIQS